MTAHACPPPQRSLQQRRRAARRQGTRAGVVHPTWGSRSSTRRWKRLAERRPLAGLVGHQGHLTLVGTRRVAYADYVPVYAKIEGVDKFIGVPRGAVAPPARRAGPRWWRRGGVQPPRATLPKLARVYDERHRIEQQTAGAVRRDRRAAHADGGTFADATAASTGPGAAVTRQVSWAGTTPVQPTDLVVQQGTKPPEPGAVNATDAEDQLLEQLYQRINQSVVNIAVTSKVVRSPASSPTCPISRAFRIRSAGPGPGSGSAELRSAGRGLRLGLRHRGQHRDQQPRRRRRGPDHGDVLR